MKLNEQIYEIVQRKIDNGELSGINCWHDLVKKYGLHTNIKPHLKNNTLSLKTLDKLLEACEIEIEVY